MRPDAQRYNYDYCHQAFDEITILKLAKTVIGRVTCRVPMQTYKIA